MKALETTWRGYRFRSRTEARWAVALTTASVKFDYEPQGYDLPSGWYLPDFWLPSFDAWLEIKGVEPTDRERALATELAAQSGKAVFIAVGAPDPGNFDQVEIFDADGGGRVIDLRLPGAAYAAARGERFDGSAPDYPGKPAKYVPPRRVRGW